MPRLTREQQKFIKAKVSKNLGGSTGQLIERVLDLDSPHFEPETAMRFLIQLEQQAKEAKEALRFALNNIDHLPR